MRKSGKSPDVASRPLSLTPSFAGDFEHADPLPLEPPGVTIVLWHFAFFRLLAQREKMCRKVLRYRRVTRAVSIIPSVYIIQPPYPTASCTYTRQDAKLVEVGAGRGTRRYVYTRYAVV